MRKNPPNSASDILGTSIPISEMSAVKDVKTTSYQFGLILQGDGSLLPVHLCTLVTRGGDVHGFLWEGEAV